jgi:integrase
MRKKRRPDGRFQIVVTIKGIRKSFYGLTQQEANIKANRWKERYGNRDISNLETLTVAGYLERWLELHSKSKQALTVSGYKNYIEKHIIPAIGNNLLDKLKPMHIREFYADELLKYKPKTVLQEHRILRKAFQDAVSDDIITKNPCDAVKAPAIEIEYEPIIYTDEEFESLVEAVRGTQDELIVMLAGLCGLRRSEIFGLMWSDIDFKNNNISINRAAVPVKGGIINKLPKNRTSYRTITMPDSVIALLKKYQGIGYIFKNQHGKQVNGSTYSHYFADLLKLHGLKHIRLHDLRHYNATLMLSLGISDKEAATRLGHANVITLRKTYQHVMDSMDKLTASKINSHYENQKLVKTLVKVKK